MPAYLTTVAGVVDTTKTDGNAIFGIPTGARYSRRIEGHVFGNQQKVPADGKWHTIRYDI
ncbi:MAG: hypothetical protein IPJ39_16815 [Saprospiraceae bacterium]|nr:hypothetical protein [Saprospiraceae bacterium]